MGRSMMEINSASDNTGLIVSAFDSISEVSSLTKGGKKQGKRKKASNNSKTSKSGLPKTRTVNRARSDIINSKDDKSNAKRRGVKPSKSMPVNKKRQNPKSSVMLWTTSAQDLASDSDSTSSRGSAFILETELDARSDLSSLSASFRARKTTTSSKKQDGFNHLGEEEKRRLVSTQKKGTLKKPKEISYRKVENSRLETEKNAWVWNLKERAPSKLEEILM